MTSYVLCFLIVGVTGSFAQFEDLSVGQFNTGKCDTLCTDQNLKLHLGSICVQIAYLYRNEIEDLYDETTIKKKSKCQDKMPLELLNNVGGVAYTYSRIVGMCYLSDKVSYCVIKYPNSMSFVHVYSFTKYGECRKGWKKKYDFSATLPPEKPVVTGTDHNSPNSFDPQISPSPSSSSFSQTNVSSFRGKNDDRSESTDTTPPQSSSRPLAPPDEQDESAMFTETLPRSGSSMHHKSTSFRDKDKVRSESEYITPTLSLPSSATHTSLPTDGNRITSSEETTQPLSSSHPSGSSTKPAKCVTRTETLQHTGTSLQAEPPSSKKCASSYWSCCMQWFKSLFCGSR